MSQCLPTGGFKWLTTNQINKLVIHSLDPDAEKGLILEVDLEYPHELHDLHNDYPLAAEKRKVTICSPLAASKYWKNIMYQ